METACDMDKPIGYWVQQTRSYGETIAVRVPYHFPSERDDREDGRSDVSSAKAAETA